MRAGQLDRRVTIERATTTTNAFGEEVHTWAPVAALTDIPASFEEVSDAERWRAAQVQVDVQCRFVIRWSTAAAGITVLDRVKFDGREYDITHKPKEMQRRRGVEITARARGE